MLDAWKDGLMPHHDRKSGTGPRWLATGVVEAPVGAVFTALLAVGPAGGADRSEPRYAPTVEVDETRHTLAVQGHWWYRGVYTVREDPRGSLVEYRVHNVARRGRWVVPLMQRRLPHDMRRDLAALLESIGRHLDRPAYLSPR